MTQTEAEVFIRMVMGPGGDMDVWTVRQKYRDKTLQEALRETFGDIADPCQTEDCLLQQTKKG